ncbi:hypothetical protein TNCV_3420281 [Trichonephila clavipes]|nr:hypothetical protein TNCV_3420281 [Trichonephila clavipes]
MGSTESGEAMFSNPTPGLSSRLTRPLSLYSFHKHLPYNNLGQITAAQGSSIATTEFSQSVAFLNELSPNPTLNATCGNRGRRNKRFSICPECQLEQASPQHILDCIELNWEDIHDSPLLVSDFVKIKHLTDQVLLHLTRREISITTHSTIKRSKLIEKLR